MRSNISVLSAQTQLTLLLTGAIVLAALSFIPNSREAVSSSETRFSEASVHGLNIIPASCASDATQYHQSMSLTTDGHGFISPPNTTENGGNIPNNTISDGKGGYLQANMYVCITNSSANTYFIPANTVAELQSVINLGTSIPGVSIYGTSR